MRNDALRDRPWRGGKLDQSRPASPDHLGHLLSAVVEELSQALTKQVVTEIRQELPKLVNQATGKRYLTRDDVLELLGCSGRQLQTLRDTRRIDYCKEGRRILYPATELYERIERGLVHARKDPADQATQPETLKK
jgi:hypothetical protein